MPTTRDTFSVLCLVPSTSVIIGCLGQRWLLLPSLWAELAWDKEGFSGWEGPLS
jgi:hypothetical protein